MNLFKYDDIVEDENGLTDGQIKKKKMRKKSQRLENEPIFKGKVNLSMEDLNAADEVWLVKIPKMVSIVKQKTLRTITNTKILNFRYELIGWKVKI